MATVLGVEAAFSAATVLRRYCESKGIAHVLQREHGVEFVMTDGCSYYEAAPSAGLIDQIVSRHANDHDMRRETG